MSFITLTTWVICAQAIILRFNGEETKSFHMVSHSLVSVSYCQNTWYFIWKEEFSEQLQLKCSGDSGLCKPTIKCLLCFAGWWYGVIGHLENCDGNEHFCRCQLSGKHFFCCMNTKKKKRLNVLLPQPLDANVVGSLFLNHKMLELYSI